MRRYVYVAYGDIGKVQLSASAKPLDALLFTGFDLYLEVSPKKWVRAADLPKEHPVWAEMKAGAFKAGLVDGEGRAFTILNAYSEADRKIAAQHGLIINSPYDEEKRQKLLEILQTVKSKIDTLKLEQLISDVSELLERIKKLHLEPPKKKQSSWDGAVNKTLTVADMLENLIKAASPETSSYEKARFKEAVEKA
ncbi:MAG: hypothetical protein QXZ68_07895, partial [Candidatus Bathyarchaeia archaeon]